VRFSISALNTEAEMDEAVRRITAVVRRLRDSDTMARG
jgi:cysteine sulfinate desulfinase/cysteine desulfurase-like protein